MQLRILQRQRHMIGNRAQQIFVRAGECPGLLVQQLQHADRLVALAANRQTQQRLRPKSQPQIHFRFKPRVRVSIRQIHRLAMRRHPSRNPAADRQTDLMLIEPQSHQRPDLVPLAIHQKNRPALRSRVPRGQLQNNVQQFRQIQSRIQPLGSLHNRRKLDHRVAPLAALQSHFRVTPEKFQPSSRLRIQFALWTRFQHSHRIRPAPQHPCGFLRRSRADFFRAGFFRCVRDPAPAARRFPATPIGAPFTTRHSRAPSNRPGAASTHTICAASSPGSVSGLSVATTCSSVSSGMPARVRGVAFRFIPCFPCIRSTNIVMSSDCAAPS